MEDNGGQVSTVPTLTGQPGAQPVTRGLTNALLAFREHACAPASSTEALIEAYRTGTAGGAANLLERLDQSRNSPENQKAWGELAERGKLESPATTQAVLGLPRQVEIRRPADTDTKTIIIYAGRPRFLDATSVSKAGTQIFRHWIRREDDLFEILKTGVLKTGSANYVELMGTSAAFIQFIYPDLRGVFFTGRENQASDPVVLNEPVAHWIDFKLPEGIDVFDMNGQSGKVLLVPQDPSRDPSLPAMKVAVEIVDSSLAEVGRLPTG